MKASVTVESAVIYPIIIAITCALILRGFYMHDRLSAKATAYTHLIKQYQTASTDYDSGTVTGELSQVCLLSGSASVYSSDSQSITISHKLGDFTVPFTHYERTISYGH